jgi:GxxExxY protein
MRVFDPIPPRFSKVARQVTRAAEQVYERLGPGLLESAYKSCLAIEMQAEGLKFERNVGVPILYETVTIEQAMQLDFIVEEAVVVTILSVDAVRPIHEMRIRTQLKFSELRIGLLVNFDVLNFKQAIKKITA